MALPARMRFRDRGAVRRVITRGFRIEIPLGRVSILPKGKEQGRILFVVSTRVAKRSVDRHGIKRRLDEWARANQQAISNWDIVVLIRTDSAKLAQRELLDRVLTLPSLMKRYDRR
jgi:ribonuclease P protein component